MGDRGERRMKGFTRCDCCGVFTDDKFCFELDVSYYAEEGVTHYPSFEAPFTRVEWVPKKDHYDLCGDCMKKYYDQIRRIIPDIRTNIFRLKGKEE